MLIFWPFCHRDPGLTFIKAMNGKEKLFTIRFAEPPLLFPLKQKNSSLIDAGSLSMKLTSRTPRISHTAESSASASTNTAQPT